MVVGHGIPEHEIDAGQLPKADDAVAPRLTPWVYWNLYGCSIIKG